MSNTLSALRRFGCAALLLALAGTVCAGPQHAITLYDEAP